ncbi:hypothetical protein BDV36DRAFT_254608 [Aspergillus pseudocaelatus]|uniref:Uncharacterized protein n=1 Tax=Aspergillus pseudocaelatus TaxID=1825620 RepID=A0ABQ6WM07_9EURO|nr:hypothetical protein BDV36DRAFT_254608 [Aspergillus pseudocaelatus]
MIGIMESNSIGTGNVEFRNRRKVFFYFFYLFPPPLPSLSLVLSLTCSTADQDGEVRTHANQTCPMKGPG